MYGPPFNMEFYFSFVITGFIEETLPPCPWVSSEKHGMQSAESSKGEGGHAMGNLYMKLGRREMGRNGRNV